METLIYILIGAGIYFLPYIIANYKKRKNNQAILVLNVLLGWTLIGWLIALIWALTDDGQGN